MQDQPPPPKRKHPPVGRVASARLAEVGVAGAAWLADQVEAELGIPITVRRIRDVLKNHAAHGIRKLGAGYYAAPRKRTVPVEDYVDGLLEEREGRMSLDEIVEAVLRAYPRGDEFAVWCWVNQIYSGPE